MSSRLFIYVVAASDNPETVECRVPWEVDAAHIFFGPCKKRLRELLRNEYLAPHVDLRRPAEDVYLVGVNGSNIRRERKIVWAGRVTKIMTFARARWELTGKRYRELRDDKQSPLHVAPVLAAGALVGYRHVSDFHDKAWMMDLVASRHTRAVTLEGSRLLLRPGVSPWKGFPRDACALCENLFFARGQGLALDTDALAILRRAQPNVGDIDGYAIFGRSRARVNGLRGRHLEIRGALADQLIAWIRRRAADTPQPRRAVGPASASCDSSS